MTIASVADALLFSLPRDSTIVSIGLLRDTVIDAFAQRRRDLRVTDLLSEAALVANSAFASVALSAADGSVVSTSGGECRVTLRRPVGPAQMEAEAATRRMADLGRTLCGLKGVALLYLAPVPGHYALLCHILPVVRDRGIMVWWSRIRDDEGPVLPTTATVGLAVYSFDVGGAPLTDDAGARASAVLFVPRTAWTPYGLDRLTQGAVPTGPLVFPATRGYDTALLDLLHPIPPVRLARADVAKRFLPVGTHVGADGGEIAEYDGVRYLRVGRRRTLTIVFMSPFGGLCDIGLVVGARISADHAADLRIGATGVEARVAWVEEWYQLRVGLPVMLDPAQGLVTITLRDLRPAGGTRDALLIKGIEVVSRPGGASEALRPEPLHPQSAARRLAF